MRLFWTRGYEATTINQLLQATRLNRGSLYATFGGKQRLFLAALDRYIGTIGQTMLGELSDPHPHRALERMFESIISRTGDSQFPRGCLITNTALECPTSGDAITRKIAGMIGAQESTIYQVLRRAQVQGSLDVTQDARALARFFVGVAQGMNVVHKAGGDPAVLGDMARVAMMAWPSARRSLYPKPRPRAARRTRP